MYLFIYCECFVSGTYCDGCNWVNYFNNVAVNLQMLGLQKTLMEVRRDKLCFTVKMPTT